jgi:hypothetical protein
VVSVTDTYGHILGFLDRSRYFYIKYLLSCTHEAEWTPFQTHSFFFSGCVGNRTRSSGSVAKNSDHSTTEAVESDMHMVEIPPPPQQCYYRAQRLVKLFEILSLDNVVGRFHHAGIFTKMYLCRVRIACIVTCQVHMLLRSGQLSWSGRYGDGHNTSPLLVIEPRALGLVDLSLVAVTTPGSGRTNKSNLII